MNKRLACGLLMVLGVIVFWNHEAEALGRRMRFLRSAALETACSKIKDWRRTDIYKTVGSHHFSDCRRNTIGIVMKVGAAGPFPACIDGYDTEGNKLVSLGLYQRGAGWAARYYACHGCGRKTPYNGKRVARTANKNTGSKNIYMKIGSTCYGPIAADKCLYSKAC